MYVCRLPENQQRIGGFFLNLMPQMKIIYVAYCSNHPSAVNVLTQHRYSRRYPRFAGVYLIFWMYVNIFCVCVCIAVRNWGSTWSQRGRPVLGSWLWPRVWVNPLPDWRGTRRCWKNWTDTWRYKTNKTIYLLGICFLFFPPYRYRWNKISMNWVKSFLLN